MDEEKLKRSLIKLNGVFPEDIEYVLGWLKAGRDSSLQAAIGQRETDLSLRFLGRYSALDDIITYIEKAVKR